jgi:hypothetical protein
LKIQQCNKTAAQPAQKNRTVATAARAFVRLMEECKQCFIFQKFCAKVARFFGGKKPAQLYVQNFFAAHGYLFFSLRC